jgi:hypothetical protein
MFRQQAVLVEQFKMRCSESTALSLINTFDGALCGIYGYERVITEMKFEDGLLQYQIETAHTETSTAKRVNFDEFYFQLISKSGKHRSARPKGRSPAQALECAPSLVQAESRDGVFTRLRRVGLDACRRVNLRWSAIHPRHLDQSRPPLSLPAASANRNGFRRFFTGNRQTNNTDPAVGRLGQRHHALVNAIKRCANFAANLLRALIREF